MVVVSKLRKGLSKRRQPADRSREDTALRSHRMFKLARELARDENGATVIEYALLASFIAVGISVIMGAVGTELALVFTGIGNALVGAH